MRKLISNVFSNQMIISHLFSGFDDAGNGILSIESYDIKLDQWTIITSAPGTMSKTWPQSLGFINNRFYISVFHTCVLLLYLN